MKFLKSLFTEHLLAKVFAVVFAAVTIYLVDRELRIEWCDVSMKMVSEPEKGGNAGPYILLRIAPDVWVHPEDLSQTIRLQIEGPDKDLAVFQRNPAVELNILDSWLRADENGVVTHTLTPEDFSLPRFPDAEINLRSTVTIRIDRFVELDQVRLVYDQNPEPFARGKKYDASRTVVNPARTRVRGPRQFLRRLGGAEGDTMALRLESPKAMTQGHYWPGVVYEARPPLAYVANQVTFSELEFAEVTLGAREEDVVILDLGVMAVTFALDYPSYETIQDKKVAMVINAQLSREVRVILEGPRSSVKPHEGAAAKRLLKQRLRLVADPSGHIKAVLGGAVPPTELLVQLVALDGALPEGLRVKSLDPNPIAISIRKLKPKSP